MSGRFLFYMLDFPFAYLRLFRGRLVDVAEGFSLHLRLRLRRKDLDCGGKRSEMVSHFKNCGGCEMH